MDTARSRVWVGWKAGIANLRRRKKGEGVIGAMPGPWGPCVLPLGKQHSLAPLPGTKAIKRTAFR